MKVKAFAKINLGLKVLDKRADGYHDIETIFARVGLVDILELTLRKDNKIIVTTEGVNIPTRQNLVWRSAWLLQKFSPRQLGVNIFLQKNIPIQAGLGGGSSDAAMTLKALNKLWGLKLSITKLEKLALSLGSDVPFFLLPGTQRGQGRGEILERIELPKRFPREAIIVVPKVRVETSWAYSRIKDKRLRIKRECKTHPSTLRQAQGSGSSLRFENSKCKKLLSSKKSRTGNYDLVNDFEKIVFKKFPELGKIKNILKKSGATMASLSGSGSAVYGLFKKRGNSKVLANRLKGMGDIFVVKIRG